MSEDPTVLVFTESNIRELAAECGYDPAQVDEGVFEAIYSLGDVVEDIICREILPQLLTKPE